MKRSAWVFMGRCLACVCCLAVCLAAPVAAWADGAPSSTPDEQVWVTNGPVIATAIGPDETIYIGGKFTYVGPDTGATAALDATSGDIAAPCPRLEGTVRTLVPDGAGGYYIGGDFTEVGGLARNDIAHILADGSVDPSFDPNANGTVYAIAVSGSTVYAGGDFTSIGGETRNNIAAIEAGNGLATAWAPNANKEVDALAVSGSTVYAGGWFTSVGGESRTGIAALDAGSGLTTAWAPNATNAPYGNANVSALAVSNSIVYAGGFFTAIGGQTRNNIAALDLSSGLATTWDPHASTGGSGYAGVLALAVSGSTVYAGGMFTTIGGQDRGHVAALGASSGLATAWDPDADGFVYALAVSGPTVYAGGSYASIGGEDRNGIAALDASGNVAAAWESDAEDAVYALAVSGSTVYAGGGFSSIGGRTRNHIAALDAGGVATDWNPNASLPYLPEYCSVQSLAVSGSTVYVGGWFTSIGGQSRHSLAALDAGSGLATDWDPDVNHGDNSWTSVGAMAVSDSTVYVGGWFDTIGNETRNNIAAIAASTGLATDWDPDAAGVSFYGVTALAVSGSTVYAGGEFTSIGGQSRNHIAALDVTSGLATAWNPNAESEVNSLAVSGATVYAGGYFTSIGGQSRNHIAAIAASTGLATDWDPDAEGVGFYGVRALAVSGSTVYAGGTFTSIGGQSRNAIAALDASSGLAAAWNPNASVSSGVSALAVSGSTVYAGGTFTSIGGQSRPYLARFTTPTPPTVASPNGGENWTVNSSHGITWGTGNGGNVTIELSRNNGSSWETLFASTANDGSEPWTLSGSTASQTLVRLSNAKGSDTSDAGFTIAPALTGSMSLAGGAAYAASTAVTIDSSVPNVGEMRFCNSDGEWSAWRTYAASTAWSLTAGDGAKTVEAQFRDADDNVLALSDEITLDSTPPVTDNNAPADWRTSAVTVHLTPTDSGSGMSGGLAKTQYSTDDGATWSVGTSVTFSTDGSHALLYRSTDVVGNVESAKSVAVRIDTSAPSTTIPGSTPTGWSKTPVTVTLLASDGGSGLATSQYRLQGATDWTPYTGPFPVTTQGASSWDYRSLDVVGNAESPKSFSLRIDSQEPTTKAFAAGVKKGKKVKLAYQVNDALPGCGEATATLKIFKGKKIKKTLKVPGTQPCNAKKSYSWRCTLAKGRYTVKVYATDIAGNAQCKVGSARLTVK